MKCRQVCLNHGAPYYNVDVRVDSSFPGFIIIYNNNNSREFINIDNVAKMIPNDEPIRNITL